MGLLNRILEHLLYIMQNFLAIALFQPWRSMIVISVTKIQFNVSYYFLRKSQHWSAVIYQLFLKNTNHCHFGVCKFNMRPPLIGWQATGSEQLPSDWILTNLQHYYWLMKWFWQPKGCTSLYFQLFILLLYTLYYTPWVKGRWLLMGLSRFKLLI